MKNTYRLNDTRKMSLSILLVLFLLTMVLSSGCINTGEGTMTILPLKANASISLSGYARGSSLETESTEGNDKADGQTWIDTQGGGEVSAQANTKVGQGDDTQSTQDSSSEVD